MSKYNIIQGNIEILAYDLPQQMQWDDVPAALLALGGNGWRLPTAAEFDVIYHLSKTGVIILKGDKYWAEGSFNGKSLYYNFRKGYSPHFIDKTNQYYIRLVRTV
jgi:hypothetical protein